MSPCLVCRRQTTSRSMCAACGRSYDRARHKDITVWAALEWACDRAWRFAGKREARRMKTEEERRAETNEEMLWRAARRLAGAIDPENRVAVEMGENGYWTARIEPRGLPASFAPTREDALAKLVETLTRRVRDGD